MPTPCSHPMLVMMFTRLCSTSMYGTPTGLTVNRTIEDNIAHKVNRLVYTVCINLETGHWPCLHVYLDY